MSLFSHHSQFSSFLLKPLSEIRSDTPTEMENNTLTRVSLASLYTNSTSGGHRNVVRQHGKILYAGGSQAFWEPLVSYESYKNKALKAVSWTFIYIDENSRNVSWTVQETSWSTRNRQNVCSVNSLSKFIQSLHIIHTNVKILTGYETD